MRCQDLLSSHFKELDSVDFGSEDCSDFDVQGKDKVLQTHQDVQLKVVAAE